MTQQTKCLAKKTLKILTASLISAAALTSCSVKQEKPLVIWTDNSEFASYVELFNATHKDAKAVVVYKAEPAHALPPAKDEVPPDLIAGPWLKNSSTRKYFTPVDYLFQENAISRSVYYRKVLDYGVINEKQYLLPVSFNLPALIFSRKNEELIKQDHVLNLNEIKAVAGEYNRKNKNGVYTSMGFAPCWNDDFMYLVTKLYGAGYREKGSSFAWDQTAIQNATLMMKEWSLARNTDTSSEQNFQFKYLYMPEYRQVTSDRCLFAYMTSDRLFTLTDAQFSGLSFRWIEQDHKIPVEDNIVTIGLYRQSKNSKQAEKFLAWFMKEETQKALIERTVNMKLDTVTFGIAGGFSALKNVNETVYPNYYRQLLSNLPSEEYISLPYILPYRWPSLKQRVILPYLRDTSNTQLEKAATLEERIADWSKQYY